MRSLVLLLTVVLPGITVASLSTYYLLSEWVVLEVSFKSYNQVVNQSSTMPDLFVVQAAENRHRISCFAERDLLGGGRFTIGRHGICTQPRKQADSGGTVL